MKNIERYFAVIIINLEQVTRIATVFTMDFGIWKN